MAWYLARPGTHRLCVLPDMGVGFEVYKDGNHVASVPASFSNGVMQCVDYDFLEPGIYGVLALASDGGARVATIHVTESSVIDYPFNTGIYAVSDPDTEVTGVRLVGENVDVVGTVTKITDRLYLARVAVPRPGSLVALIEYGDGAVRAVPMFFRLTAEENVSLVLWEWSTIAPLIFRRNVYVPV